MKKSGQKKAGKALGEFELIEKMSANVSVNDSVILGIGDDAAEICVSKNHNLLVTTDLLVEDVHFRLKHTTAFELGQKSMAVNLSDIAAMGAKPLAAFISVAIPKRINTRFCLDLFKGMNKLAKEFNTAIAGGDTTSSTDKLTINVTLLGEAKRGTSLTRKGANAHDSLWLAGYTGLSRAGFESLENKLKASEKLRKAHKCPAPLVHEGLRLAASGSVTSCIDVSDGLLGDLTHILKASGVAAKIELSNLPVKKELETFCRQNKTDHYDYLLNGGEDYALLFTAKNKNFLKDWPQNLYTPVQIGTIEKGSGISLVKENGEIVPALVNGFDHFGKS